MDNYDNFSVEDLPNYDGMTFTHPITGIKYEIECDECDECPCRDDLKVYFVFRYNADFPYNIELYCDDCIRQKLSPDTDGEHICHNGFYFGIKYWAKCPICSITPVQKVQHECHHDLKTVSTCNKCLDSIGEHLSHQLNHNVSKQIMSFLLY